jgi:hypothetical protein
MHCRRTVIALLTVTSSLGHAQDAAPSVRETIQQLVQQVKELQDKVKVLESQPGFGANPGQGSGSTYQPAAGPSPTQEEASNLQRESLPEELHELHGIKWRGFGEVNYKVLNQRTPELGTYGFVPGSHGNFYTGDFDLLLTSRINDKASVLAEMVFGEQDAQTFSVDLERVLLKYDYNDHLKMSFGRYHTGIGYYNTAFHSGSWLQTTADRPLIMEFANDGGPLPTQAIGVSVTGEILSGRLGLHYTAEYGSSDMVRPDLKGGTVDDENNSNQVTFGLFVRPSSIPGLQVGTSIYHDRISDVTHGPSVRLGQTIANVHLVYTGHSIEALNEGFLIRHDYEQTATVYNMPAFYSQLSKQFGRLRPFFRYQYINANPDSLIEDIALRRGPSFGARWDFNDNVAFKSQLDHTLRKDQPDLNALHLQLAFAF